MEERTKIDFSILESSTEVQNKIANWLLLACAEETMENTKSNNERGKRRKQFEELVKVIMPNFHDDKRDLINIVKDYWNEECKWLESNNHILDQKLLESVLAYRVQRVFFKNYGIIPFKKTVKKKEFPDNEDFQKINQKIFKQFLKISIELISKEKCYQKIKKLISSLEILKDVNISEYIENTSYKIYDKDWKIAKGLLVGGAAGGVASIFLGPIIGSYIGEMAGLSGAAATNYGLALLGGGSIASGGLGMAGGNMLLGLGFGIANGIKEGKKNASRDELIQAQAKAILPLLLSIGRVQSQELNDSQIPLLMHNTINNRLKDLEDRLDDLSTVNKEEDKEKIKSVEESIIFYTNASEMSKTFDWYSGYDVWSNIKEKYSYLRRKIA